MNQMNRRKQSTYEKGVSGVVNSDRTRRKKEGLVSICIVKAARKYVVSM